MSMSLFEANTYGAVPDKTLHFMIDKNRLHVMSVIPFEMMIVMDKYWFRYSRYFAD